MKILLWLVLVPILLIALLFLLSFIFKSDWYNQLKYSVHNKKTITRADKILLREAFGKEVMKDCYLTSVAWSDIPPETRDYFNRLKLRNLVPTDHEKIKSHVCPCPSCGLKPEELVWIGFRTPDWTWRNLCGRQGYLSVCPCCKIAVSSIVTLMN